MHQSEEEPAEQVVEAESSQMKQPKENAAAQESAATLDKKEESDVTEETDQEALDKLKKYLLKRGSDKKQ